MSAATEIATIIEKAKPRNPGKCHSIDHRGWAYCGAFGPGGGGGNTHSHKECVARGHKHCLKCTELERQLGCDDYRMVA
jgi:hypothetical protein